MINIAIAGAVVAVAVVVVAVVLNTHVDSSALSVQLLNQNFRIGRLPSTGGCARNL